MTELFGETFGEIAVTPDKVEAALRAGDIDRPAHLSQRNENW